jgi:hypothetical protein
MLKKTTVTTVQGRWPIKGRNPTVKEIIELASALSSVDQSQEIWLEPAGINGAGKSDPACFLLKPYMVDEDNHVV